MKEFIKFITVFLSNLFSKKIEDEPFEVIDYVNEQYRSTFKNKPGGFNDTKRMLRERKLLSL